jgi:hypothetical protein
MELRLASAVPAGGFEVGEMIPYEVTITNIGQKPVSVQHINPSLFPPDEYSILLTDEKGKVLAPDGRLWMGSFADSAGLKPGLSLTYRGAVNRWGMLNKPGKYTARAYFGVTAPGVSSQPVDFEIKPWTHDQRDKRLHEAVDALRKASTPKDRLNAIVALGITLDSGAIPLLIQELRAPGANSLAVESALLMMPDRGAVRSAVLAELKGYGSNEPLAYMLSWLQIPEKESVPLLCVWLKNGNAAQRASALQSLAMNARDYSDSSIKPAILSSLKDPDANVRRYAVAALAAGKYADTLNDVMEIAKSDSNSTVREQAVISLGSYKDDGAVPLLESLAKDKSVTISRYAREALNMIHSAAADAALKRVYGQS